jgi:hypothetical protein
MFSLTFLNLPIKIFSIKSVIEYFINGNGISFSIIICAMINLALDIASRTFFINLLTTNLPVFRVPWSTYYGS